jgi:hypothetical protein
MRLSRESACGPRDAGAPSAACGESPAGGRAVSGGCACSSSSSSWPSPPSVPPPSFSSSEAGGGVGFGGGSGSVAPGGSGNCESGDAPDVTGVAYGVCSWLLGTESAGPLIAVVVVPGMMSAGGDMRRCVVPFAVPFVGR